jgi:hypothetical protein
MIPLAVGTGCLVVLIAVLDQRRDHAIMANSATSEGLEREIRAGLPLGSPRPAVEGFLAKRGIEFSFDASSRSVYAVVRKLRGSTASASKCLQLQFRFDDASNLMSIEAKVLYTGP